MEKNKKVNNHEASGFSNIPDDVIKSPNNNRQCLSDDVTGTPPIYDKQFDGIESPISPCIRVSNRDSGYLTDSPASYTGGTHFFSPNSQNLTEESEEMDPTRQGSRYACQSMDPTRRGSRSVRQSEDGSVDDLEDSGAVDVLLESSLDISQNDGDMGIEMRPADNEVFEEQTYRQVASPTTSPISIPHSPRMYTRSVGDDVVPTLGNTPPPRHTQYSTVMTSSPLHARVTLGTQTPHPTASSIDSVLRQPEHDQVYHGGSTSVNFRRQSVRGNAVNTMRERMEFETRNRADTDPQIISTDTFASRSRAQSVPTFSPRPSLLPSEDVQDMGRELRRIGDDFHLSYSGEHAQQEESLPQQPNSFPRQSFLTRIVRRLGFVREDEAEPPARRHSTSVLTRHAHLNHK